MITDDDNEDDDGADNNVNHMYDTMMIITVTMM